MYPYRLSDCLCLGPHHQSRVLRKNTKNHFPQSIAGKYITITNIDNWVNENNEKMKCYSSNALAILSDIAKSSCPAFIKEEVKDSCLIHLRLGDVVCKKGANDLRLRPPHPKILAQKIRENVDSSVVLNIIKIPESNFQQQCKLNSEAYLKELVHLLSKSHKLNFLENDTKDPQVDADRDFCRMIFAKEFVQGKGGFSRTAMNLRKFLDKKTISIKELTDPFSSEEYEPKLDEDKPKTQLPQWFWPVLITFVATWLVLVPVAWVYYTRLRSKGSSMLSASLALSILSLIIPFFGIGPPIIYAKSS